MGYRVFTEEFKKQVVEESIDRKEVASVARKYNISTSSIFKWRKRMEREEQEEESKHIYTKEYMKMVVKTRLTKKHTAKSCSKIFKIPEYLVTFWTQEFEKEVMEEIRAERFARKRRVFVHATSHSGYLK